MSIMPISPVLWKDYRRQIEKQRQKKLRGSVGDWWSIVRPGIEYRVAQDLLERANDGKIDQHTIDELWS